MLPVIVGARLPMYMLVVLGSPLSKEPFSMPNKLRSANTAFTFVVAATVISLNRCGCRIGGGKSKLLLIFPNVEKYYIGYIIIYICMDVDLSILNHHLC